MSEEKWNVELSENFDVGTWEDRIVRRKVQRTGGFIYEYSICEIMYTSKGEIFLCSDPKLLSAEGLEWLRDSWLDILSAFAKPVLDYDRDINTEAVHQLREAILSGASEMPEELSQEEFLAEVGMTEDEFLEEIGEDNEFGNFDPEEYCRSQLFENDRQEREFKKYHGKPLEEIFDEMVEDKIKREESL